MVVNSEAVAARVCSSSYTGWCWCLPDFECDAILYKIHCLTGTRCSLWSSGLASHRLATWSTICAALLCTHCSIWMLRVGAQCKSTAVVSPLRRHASVCQLRRLQMLYMAYGLHVIIAQQSTIQNNNKQFHLLSSTLMMVTDGTAAITWFSNQRLRFVRAEFKLFWIHNSTHSRDCQSVVSTTHTSNRSLVSSRPSAVNPINSVRHLWDKSVCAWS